MRDDAGKPGAGELLFFFAACAALWLVAKLDNVRKAVGW